MANENYIRREKKLYKAKETQGDPKVKLDSDVAAPSTAVSDEDIKFGNEVFDDAIKVKLLDNAEQTLSDLEDLVKEQLDEFNLLIDPDKNFPLIIAISTLAGEPKVLLDGDILQMAADLSMDGPIHLNGFDPVAAVLGLYGGDQFGPNVPIPSGLLSVEAAKCAALCAMLDNPILL